MSGPKASSHTVMVSTRRSWAAWEKRAIVDEAQRTTGSISAVARRHGITPSLLFRWRRELRQQDHSPERRPRRPLSRWRYLLPLRPYALPLRAAAVWWRSSGPGDGCELRVPLIGTPSWRSSASWSGADDPGSDRRARVARHGPHGHAQRLRRLGPARAGDAPA